MKRAAAALSVALLLGGCAKSEPAPAPTAPSAPTCPACECRPDAAIVDAVLLAYLSQASAAHRKADLEERADAKTDAERRAAKVRAIEALDRFVQAPRPPGPAAPEAVEVLADTRARLAELRSDLGDFDAATRDLDEGLGLAKSRSYYRGRLFEVRGIVEERREKALRAKGDAAGAAKAREEAAKALEEATVIQMEIVKDALERKKREKSANP